MTLFTKFPKIDHSRLIAAIERAEKGTSGEIRVAIARRKAKDPIAVARHHFERLAMHRTADRNGVLILIAPRSRNFAIIGDAGVHEKCGDVFWREVADAMAGYFKRSEFETGIIHGIERAGALLGDHFPVRPGDRNELPNDVEEV